MRECRFPSRDSPRESTVPSLYIQEQLPRLFRRSLSTEVGFSGKITFLRQTLRQHVPRLNWKQSSKGMKRSDPFTGMPLEANKILEVCRALKD